MCCHISIFMRVLLLLPTFYLNIIKMWRKWLWSRPHSVVCYLLIWKYMGWFSLPMYLLSILTELLIWVIWKLMIYLIIKPRSKILRTTIKYMSFDNIGISNEAKFELISWLKYSLFEMTQRCITLTILTPTQE